MTTISTILGDQWMVNGAVSANFHLAVYDDNGKELMRSNPHVVCLMPDADLKAVFDAVNSDIATRETLMWPPIQQADWDRLTGHCSIEHTPEVKAEFAQFRAKSEITARQMKPV